MLQSLSALVLGLIFATGAWAQNENQILSQLGIQNPRTTLESLASTPQCWVCASSNGHQTFNRPGLTKSEAQSESLLACDAYGKPATAICQMGRCWTAAVSECQAPPAHGGSSSGGSGAGSAPKPFPKPEPQPVLPPTAGRCVTNFDCATGLQVCLDGQCVNKGGLNNQCHSDIDCGFPNKCLGGRCGESGIDGCSSDIDCPGQQCQAGRCVMKPIPPPPPFGAAQCFSDTQCGMFQHCVGGFCSP